MRTAMATDQMRCSRTHAILLRTLLQGGNQLRMIGKTEVIIAAKGQVGFAIYCDMYALRRFQHAACALQALRGEGFEFAV